MTISQLENTKNIDMYICDKETTLREITSFNFDSNTGICCRTKTYLYNNEVVAFCIAKEGSLDPELHVSVKVTANPRLEGLYNFLRMRCGVYNGRNIVSFDIKEV